jgi:hypothetical protein
MVQQRLSSLHSVELHLFSQFEIEVGIDFEIIKEFPLNP